MGTNLEFDSEARAEFDEALNWHAERSAGAALGFVSEVDLAIERITNNPALLPYTYAGCQRCTLHRYPYSVIFHRRAAKIVVIALAHAKRLPGYWRHRRS
jgi:plasmid stabilization system protein ParE